MIEINTYVLSFFAKIKTRPAAKPREHVQVAASAPESTL